MRRYLVVGNWKMHGSIGGAKALTTELKQSLSSAQDGCEIAVCPPMALISCVASELNDSVIAWGGQNVHECSEGAYTGETSAPMLAEIGCRYVIVGHSERRTIFGESDNQVALKFQAARESKLVPILCLGESLETREAGNTLSWVEGQLQAVIDLVGVDVLGEAVVAYEPIWAIGTGKTATPEQAQEVHEFIRSLLAKQSQQVAQKVRILYGGSVNAGNASALFAQPDIDGALVGGASLKAQDFTQICKAAI